MNIGNCLNCDQLEYRVYGYIARCKVGYCGLHKKEIYDVKECELAEKEI